MTPAHLVAVTDWVNWVAQATGLPSGSDPEASIKTRAVVLGGKYPDTRMFTQASAAYVAIECGLMTLPAAGILSKLLERWWVKNKPVQVALAAPGVAELEVAVLSGEDRMAARVWLQRDAEGLLSQRDMTARLDVMRKANEHGYRWLIAHNDRAIGIARQSGWVRAPSSDDFSDPKAILASVRNIVDPPHPLASFWLRALRSAVANGPAPHLVDLVPFSVAETVSGAARTPTPQHYADMRSDEGIAVLKPPAVPALPPDALIERFQGQHGRKPGDLTKEQIQANRIAHGMLPPERQSAVDAESLAPPDDPPPADDEYGALIDAEAGWAPWHSA